MYLAPPKNSVSIKALQAIFNTWQKSIDQYLDSHMQCDVGEKMFRNTYKICIKYATEYISTSPLATHNGTTEEQFEQIGEQMWIAFIPNHQEVWGDIRRAGYPVIAQHDSPKLSNGVINGYLPKRLKYPYTVEKKLNDDNMQEAIDRMGGDEITTPVWWDVRD